MICNKVRQEICTCINIIFGMVTFIGIAIGIGYGARAMLDFLKFHPSGLVTSTPESGYYIQ